MNVLLRHEGQKRHGKKSRTIKQIKKREMELIIESNEEREKKRKPDRLCRTCRTWSAWWCWFFRPTDRRGRPACISPEVKLSPFLCFFEGLKWRERESGVGNLDLILKENSLNENRNSCISNICEWQSKKRKEKETTNHDKYGKSQILWI